MDYKPDDRHERLQTMAAFAQCILAVAALIGSVAVALHVWYSQAQMTSRQINKATRDSWIAVDLAALSDDELLVVADNLMDPANLSDPIEKRKKRWFAYAVLNIIIERYDAAREGLIGPEEEIVAGCRQLLKTLMADDDVFAITQGHGYEKAHIELCRSVRDEVMRERAASKAK
jgi:hypothetical protein